MTNDTFLHNQQCKYLKAYFEWSSKDNRIYLPNEIFKELTEYSCQTFSFRHRAFAYSYYYIVCYLYRNAKYGAIEPLDKLNSLMLISILNCDRKYYNYIIKKDGVLDILGYTKSENDFPLNFIIEEGELAGFQLFSEMESYIRKSMNVPTHFVCKKPLKAFQRTPDSTYNNGTFFEFYNTHCIDFSIFTRCLSYGKQGIEYFYVYAFLLAFSEFINQKKSIYRSYILISLSMSKKKLQACLTHLETMGLIQVTSSTMFHYKIIKHF